MVLNILKFGDLSLIVRKEKGEFEARLANAGVSEAVLTTKCMSICIGEVLGKPFLLASLSGCRRDRNDILTSRLCSGIVQLKQVFGNLSMEESRPQGLEGAKSS